MEKPAQGVFNESRKKLFFLKVKNLLLKCYNEIEDYTHLTGGNGQPDNDKTECCLVEDLIQQLQD